MAEFATVDVCVRACVRVFALVFSDNLPSTAINGHSQVNYKGSESAVAESAVANNHLAQGLLSCRVRTQ